MKNKKYILALFVIVAILSISVVSAADDDSGSMISADDNQDLILEDIQEDVDTDDELIASNEQSKPNLEESNEGVVGESRTVETPSFTEIQNVVSGSNDGDTIYLKNQTYYGSGQDIVVGKSLTFIGNDTVLDANNQSGIFNVPEGVHTITFKNLKFINGGHGTIFSRSINTNFINCTFADNTCNYNSHHNYVIINNTDANVNILECTFENNTCPEGNAFLFILANNTVIDKCTFNNIISLWDSSECDRATIKCVSDNIILKNSNITNNIRHYFYHTVLLYGKSITVSNCNFDNNSINTSSYANGVLGLYNNDYENTKKAWDTLIANVENCSFTNNHPKGHVFYNIEVSITTNGWYKDPVTEEITRPEFSEMNYANVTLRNIVFDNNEGMALYGTFVNETNINNCSFRNMLPDSYNRLIYLISNKTTVTDSIFENSPHCCIGDHNDNTDLRVYNCTFVNVGQGICLTDDGDGKKSLTVKDCSFINITNGSIYGERLENCFIDNCDFINNSAEMGAAICLQDKGYVENGNTLITNCYFESNSATRGAIFINKTGSTNKTIIDNCIFVNNSADYGGAIYFISNNTAITNCNLEKNNGFIKSACIYSSDGSDNSVIENCNFVNNFATGSVCINLYYTANSNIVNCKFINNTASYMQPSDPAIIGPICEVHGKNNNVTDCIFKNNILEDENNGFRSGSLYLHSNDSFVSNCIFEDNSLFRSTLCGYMMDGGALAINGHNATVVNCSFARNRIDVNSRRAAGGAIFICNPFRDIIIKNCSFDNNYVKNDYSDAFGGAIFSHSYNVSIVDCSFVNNYAIGNCSAGGAIAFDFECNNSAIINCTFENNSAAGGYSDYEELDVGGGAVSYADYETGYTHTIANSTFLNNKAASRYLNLTRTGTVLAVTLEGYEKLFHAIYPRGNQDELNFKFYNVTYWDGEMLNTDNVPAVVNCMAGNQPIVFDFFDPRGKLVESITRMTDSNGQASFDYSELPDGVYTYVVYHPDNSYYSYIKGGEGFFVLRASYTDLQNKIDQATDSITLENDYFVAGSVFGIQINKNLTIYGNGHSIDAGEQGRIFNVHEGVTLTLINVTLENGYYDNGGAINNYNGTVIIINSTLNNNRADAEGGAIFNTKGTVTIINSTLENGVASKGGAVSNQQGSVTIVDSTLKNNYATKGSVIATDNGESVILDNVKFVDNKRDPVYCENGEIDTSGVKTLTAVEFTIGDIADFLNGSSITINVAEIIKGTEFNGNVTVSIGNSNYTIEVLNGIGSKTVTPNLAYGDYVAKLYFAETDVYDCASAQTNMFHVMNNPQINLSIANIQTGDSFTVKVNTIYTFNGALNVVINGVTYVVDVVNGAGSKTISTNLNPGSYNASIDYAGNENFTADSASTSFTVSKRTTSITASAVTATYSVSKNLIATLKDKTGKAISGVKVTIKLNGKTYTKTTDKNGQVKLGVASLIPKTYTATITFAGNDIYEKSSKNVKVVVKKATPKMTAKAKTFRVKVKVKKYAITLKTNKNKVMKNTKVTLKINKKTFTAKTNKKGVATFKITNLKKKGKFTAVIKYAGNKYYNKLTKKAKITVKK